jgi:hypothetical protein
MSEEITEKKLRTKNEINIEYTQCAMKLGDYVFKSALLSEDIKRIQDIILRLKEQMSSLNSEPFVTEPTSSSESV